jgi:hypothetical protein
MSTGPSKFVPISSDAKALDGLNVQIAVCDEIGSSPIPSFGVIGV